MGLFDFGGSRSRSRSDSSSSSFDNLDSFGFNFGRTGSSSSGISGGSSSSRSGSVSQDRIAFEDIFASLFGGASSAAGAVNTGALTTASNLLFNSGAAFLDTLGGGGAGARALEERLASRDGLADEQISLLGEDISRFLSEDVNPAIKESGVVASTLGGSRGEVQRGMATDSATREFARGAVDIRSRDQAARDSIAGMLAQDESSRAGTALSSLPGLFGLAEGGALASLSPFAALSSILGPATVLSSSSSAASSEASDFARQLSEAFGIDFGFDSTRGRAGSQSRSSSSSRSDSVSFGF